jgi:hypothetical protein
MRFWYEKLTIRAISCLEINFDNIVIKRSLYELIF